MKEQILLKKLYECQDMIEELLYKGKVEHQFNRMIQVLIKRLETHLQNNQDLL